MKPRPLPRLPRGLGRDAAGTVSVEFALLLPVLLTMFFGCYEASNLVLAELKLSDATQTVADLVAQTKLGYVLQSSDFSNFDSAATEVMTPLPGAKLKLAYASITYSSGKAVIDWHKEVNGAAPIVATSVPANLGLNGTQDSVIVIAAQYAYTSPISYVLQANYTLNETSYNRPRYVACIPSYLNTNSTCP